MGITIITVGSMTYAMKARKILRAEGINTRLVKLDSALTEHGCGYGIEFRSYDSYNVYEALKKHNIKYSIYRDALK